MNCNFGPYQITTKLESVGENAFIDNSKSKQAVVFGDCNSIIPPCEGAVVLKRQNDCPQCDIAWFDCPSIMGREYTLLATPCGVTITSFSDGLVSLQGCDATIFGSGHFCFGYIYSSAGKFKSNDESLVSFIFDDHEFSVRGNLGFCSDDMFACEECQPNELVTAFADLPTPPSVPSDPSIAGDDTEKKAGVDDVPATKTIPSENRSTWTDLEDTITFGEAFCEETERRINSGVNIGKVDWGDENTSSGGKKLLVSESNDNPSIATLPSGHTIIAYEHRGADGLTKISLAILSSSVRRNIRYYRSLSRGVLLNNLAKTEGEAHFEVFDEIGEISPFSLSIGFLTGPLKGTITLVNSIARTVDGSRIKHLFKFSTNGRDIEFPDKNDIHDVGWFLSDEEASDDLPPPGVENVTTILNLPDHKDGKTTVPVAYPSIAVAQNNLMTMPEQNIYVTYQAFEGNEWRVYLREILLGNKVGDNPPTYLAPYLFEEGSQRQIKIMQTSSLLAQTFGLGVNYWNEDFGKSSISKIGELFGGDRNWLELTDVFPIRMPIWSVWDPQLGPVNTKDTSVYYCDPDSTPDALRPCSTDTPSKATCIGVWNSIEDEDTPCSVGVDLENIQTYTRAFAVKTGDIPNVKDIAITMRFAIIGNGSDPATDTFPEIWFTFGKSNADPLLINHADGWRLQILRGNGSILASSGVAHDDLEDPDQSRTLKSCATGCGGASGSCFIFRLYDSLDRPLNMENQYDWHKSNGQDDDVPVREIWKCVDTVETLNDYVIDSGWNEWRVETYLRGKKRIFDIYLNNSTTNNIDVLMASFQEWDTEELRKFRDSIFNNNIPQLNGVEFGTFHGFGHFHGNNSNQLIFDRIRADELMVPTKGSVSSIVYEDDMTADEHFSKSLDLDFNSDFPSSFSYYLHNTINEHGYSNQYGYRRMLFVDDPFHDDTFYNSNIVRPSYRGTHAELRDTIQHDFHFSITHIDATTDDWGNSNSEESDNISMTLSVGRDSEDAESWPHVWFLLRLESRDSKWWNGYRVRISRFTAKNNYAAAILEQHNGIRPEIFEGQAWWRLQLFLPLPGESSDDGGNATDNLYKEIYIKITGDVPDWVDIESSPTVTNPQAHIWPYFKVDTTIEPGEPGSFVRFKIYVGSDVEGDHTFDDATFTLLHTFDTNDVVDEGARRPVYGFCLFVTSYSVCWFWHFG